MHAIASKLGRCYQAPRSGIRVQIKSKAGDVDGDEAKRADSLCSHKDELVVMHPGVMLVNRGCKKSSGFE